MRLLIWTQYFWPENFRINEMILAMKQKGLHVSVVTGKPNYPDGLIFKGYNSYRLHREDFNGIEVIRLPIIPRGSNSPLRLSLNYLSFIISGFIFAPLTLLNRKIDLIFVYAPSPLIQALPAIFIAWLKRAQLVVWVQDLWPESLSATGYINNKWLLKPVELLVRIIYKYSDSILIQSPAFLTSVERLVRDGRKIHFFPNTAEPMQHSKTNSGNNHLIEELKNSFSVVFAGNIGVAQSISTIVDAAELLSQDKGIRLYIIGSGSKEEWLKREVSLRNLGNIIIVGRLPFEEMSAIFEASSALLVTLKGDKHLSTTIPSKIQSYLSSGKPIIASMDGEGARIVTEASAGLVCAAEDSKALAASIRKLSLMNTSELKLMGENGLCYFMTHFEQSKKLDELIKHFESLIK